MRIWAIGSVQLGGAEAEDVKGGFGRVAANASGVTGTPVATSGGVKGGRTMSVAYPKQASGN